MQGRTHNCGQLRLANVGEEVKLVGWYENLRKVSKILDFDFERLLRNDTDCSRDRGNHGAAVFYQL
mgnify:CR=1 FL=1